MDTPLELSFHNMDPSPALKEAVDRHVKGLEKFFDHIVGCRVVVEMPHKSHRTGHNVPDAHIVIRVPGKELVVSRDRVSGTDAYQVLDSAFGVAQALLKDHRRVVQGNVKHKSQPDALA